MELEEKLMEYIQKLEPHEQEILKLRFSDGLTAGETALYFNVTRGWIVKLEKRIMQKLKNEL